MALQESMIALHLSSNLFPPGKLTKVYTRGVDPPVQPVIARSRPAPRSSATLVLRSTSSGFEYAMPAWLQFATSFGFAAAFAWSRTLLGIPPRGRTPSLKAWLRRRPPFPKRPETEKLRNPEGGASDVGMMQQVYLRPATTLSGVWEAYLFAGSFSTIPAALQILEFPAAFLDWRRSDGLIPGLPNTPPPLDPTKLRALPGNEDDVVKACDEMIDSYGGVLCAVYERPEGSESELLGTLALRVKWLPDACRSYDQEGLERGRVVRTVPFKAVLEGRGLEAVAYLEQFAVAPDWRGSGLAARMLQEAEERARFWGLHLLALHVQRDDWQPLRFFEKTGFEISSDWMGRGPQFFLLVKLL
ncbi:unnamed protein product [Symbiodinium necroappetens]|uniref:N-acetyltransferase domain-containing protein n=1 Tax=Symbiodinium necroappetens TaxID=1628268 RepID=A0A812R001_9DINO|nr:unnamed protein product [Symbiodinium necroappetens]